MPTDPLLSRALLLERKFGMAMNVTSYSDEVILHGYGAAQQGIGRHAGSPYAAAPRHIGGRVSALHRGVKQALPGHMEV